MSQLERDGAGFMRSICADPGEDTHRLAFADWLDEVGGEPDRAEFIRAQVEVARLAAHCESAMACAGCFCYECQRYDDLRRRERELLQGNRYKWLDGIIPADAKPLDRNWTRFRTCVTVFEEDLAPEFSRGFMSHVTCSGAAWLKHADDLAWHPSQKVGCDRCCGLGCNSVGIGEKPYSVVCPDCNDGKVERPFPRTAQPIERVTLTEVPFLQRLSPFHLFDFRSAWDWIAFDFRPLPAACHQV